MPIRDFIKITINRNVPMEIGKFLCPEFIKFKGLTINDLKLLRPLVDNLDDMHLYEKVIYDAYIHNGNFVLNEYQLNEAYKIYKQYRYE